MQSLIIVIVSILFIDLSYACPQKPPPGFAELKKEKDTTTYTNADKSVIIGVRCLGTTKDVSYKSLQFFKNRTILNETTSYYSLSKDPDVISRIYFKVRDQEIVHLSVITKKRTRDDFNILEKIILDFL